MEVNVYSVDVTIHGSIWDAQKHLLQMLYKKIEIFIENIMISVTIQ